MSKLCGLCCLVAIVVAVAGCQPAAPKKSPTDSNGNTNTTSTELDSRVLVS